MKILHVIDQLNVGGAERLLVDLSNILYRNGVKVHVLILTPYSELRRYIDKGITVLQLNRKNKFNPFKLFELHTICSQYDLIHVHLRYNLRYIGLAKIIFVGKYRVLLHDHFGDIDTDKNVPVGMKLLIRKSWFAGVNSSLVDWAVNVVGLDSLKTFYLPNIVIRERLITKEIHGNTRGKLLLVSNFRDSKNVFFALDILEALVIEDREITLTIFGRINDQKYFRDFQEELQRRNLSERVEIIHTVSRVQQELHQFEIAIHVAKLESGPLVLIEYLAQGLPFVTYETGEVVHQIKSELPECIVKSFDVTEWSYKILQIRNSDQDNLKKRMNRVFDEFFSEKTYFDRCMEMYKEILK